MPLGVRGTMLAILAPLGQSRNPETLYGQRTTLPSKGRPLIAVGEHSAINSNPSFWPAPVPLARILSGTPCSHEVLVGVWGAIEDKIEATPCNINVQNS